MQKQGSRQVKVWIILHMEKKNQTYNGKGGAAKHVRRSDHFLSVPQFFANDEIFFDIA
jgi:hypothetical protein